MLKIKGLSIRQPFTTFILFKLKDIEHRKYHTNFRGFFLIHSSKIPDHKFMKEYGFNKMHFINGCLLGIAELIDVEHYGEDSYGWRLDNVYKFQEALDYKGKQGFFEVELNEKIIEQVKKVLPLVCWDKINDLKDYLHSGVNIFKKSEELDKPPVPPINRGGINA